MENIEDLIRLLTLEELDPCLYRGQSFMTPWGRVFGGQVLGQAMYAAYQTVPEDRLAHSMHAYFVLGGDCNFPIIYHVDTIRDGGSYTTRRLNPNPAPPFRNIWLRAKEKLADSIPLQHQLLAYASDYNLLLTAVNPHQAKADRGNFFLASLDHAMWFHRDFNMSDWLLYALDSPSASNGRGFSRGNIFDQNGILVASVVQEGVIRVGKK